MIQHNCALVNLRFRKGDGDCGSKMSEDLVQRGRKNKGLRGFVHQVRGGRWPKRGGDLVQRERKNKGLRGFVHQVRGGRGVPTTPRAHHTAGPAFAHHPAGRPLPNTVGPRAHHTARPPHRGPARPAPRAPTTPRAHQKKTIKNGTMVRQVHRSGALNWYAMWGRVRISSVLSERSVLQPFC